MIELRHFSIGGEPLDLKLQNALVYGIFGDREDGSSRLLSCLAGVRIPHTGELRINGFSLAKDTMRAKACFGYAPASLPYDPDLTVSELLLFAAELCTGAVDRTVRRAEVRLEEFDLADKRSTLVRRLSPLEQRLLSVVLALVGEPEILFLDAPTAGLSVEGAQTVCTGLTALAAEKTLFLAGITPTEATTLCDRVLFFEDGCLVLNTDAGDARIAERYAEQAVQKPSSLPKSVKKPSRLFILSEPGGQCEVLDETDDKEEDN